MPEILDQDAGGSGGGRAATWLASLLIVILVACAAVVRVVELPRAFTQVDDIGVASTILEARREIRTAGDLRAIINNPQLRQYGSTKFKLLRKADSAGLLGPAFGAFAAARDVLVVPARWSYAPAQYAITAPLLSEDASYRRTLVAGRAASAAFSIAAIALVGLAAARLRLGGEMAPALVATALTALSLELFVYSTHMSNYALGVLASTVLLSVPAIDMGRWRSAWPAIGFGVGFWALILASYQVLPLIAAAFTSIGLCRLIAQWPHGSKPADAVLSVARSAWLRRLAVSVGVFALLMIPTYLVLLSSVRPITWNAGPHGEFVFPGAHAGLGAIAGFVGRNSWLIFSAMTTPMGWDDPLRAPLTAAFAVLFLLGLASLLSDHSRPRRFGTGLFIAISLLVTLAMALAGLTALSPTRHALILLPLFALAVGEGTGVALRGLVPRPAWRTPVAAGLVAGLMAVWALALPDELARRRDPFDEGKLASAIAVGRPAALLAYGYTYALDLMPAVRAEVPLFNRENLNFPWFAGRLPKADGATLVMSSSGPLTPDERLQLGQAVARATPAMTPWRWCPEARILWREERPARSDMEVYPIPAGGANGYFAYLTAPCAGGS